MRYIKHIALLVAFVFLCGFGGGSSGGGSGGGSPTGIAGGDLGGSYPNPTITLTGDVTKSGGSTATTAVATSHLQQPIMFIGSSPTKTFSGATTTGTITSPGGVANGDQEIVFIQFNNTTSSAFTPPAGWSAIASCNTNGNTNQAQAFSHTASSEGGTIAAFTWTTSASGEAWAVAYRNAAIDVCVMNNAAASTTFSATGLTAAATTDRVIAWGGQPTSGGYITNTAVTTGLSFDAFGVSNTAWGYGQVSYPITSTTVAAFGMTSGVSQTWVGGQIALSFAASTTAGPQGALTYNQFGSPYLAGLMLGGGLSVGTSAGADSFSLMLPLTTGATAVGGIGAPDSNGIPRGLLYPNSTGATLTLGDTGANNSGGYNITLAGPTQIKADNLVSTLPRMPIAFSIAQTSISTGVNLACTKTVKAITIENDEGTWSIGASCNGQVIRVYDCGTSAPANAGCSGGTQLTTNTYSTTAGTVTDGTISQASVAAGHYMCAQIQASGSCTTMYGQETLMARPQ